MLQNSEFVKIRVIVPVDCADAIRAVMGKNGAGAQGQYEYCTGSYRQIGRFRPLPGAHPAVGEVGQFEEVEEEVIETLCHREKLEKVLSAVKKAHPYEEPAIDILSRLEVK